MDNDISAPLSLSKLATTVLSSSITEDIVFAGKVIIIGAGAAGLAAAHFLHEKGVDCLVLEASALNGGRLKKLKSFAEFPLDAGAEWLHDHSSVVGALLTDTLTTVYADRSKVFYWFDKQI